MVYCPMSLIPPHKKVNLIELEDGLLYEINSKKVHIWTMPYPFKRPNSTNKREDLIEVPTKRHAFIMVLNSFSENWNVIV